MHRIWKSDLGLRRGATSHGVGLQKDKIFYELEHSMLNPTSGFDEVYFGLEYRLQRDLKYVQD